MNPAIYYQERKTEYNIKRDKKICPVWWTCESGQHKETMEGRIFLSFFDIT